MHAALKGEFELINNLHYEQIERSVSLAIQFEEAEDWQMAAQNWWNAYLLADDKADKKRYLHRNRHAELMIFQGGDI